MSSTKPLVDFKAAEEHLMRFLAVEGLTQIIHQSEEWVVSECV